MSELNPIVARDLSKRYRKGNEAVRRLSFAVERGMVYGLLGRNGSGKTTTIKTMMGLLHPTEGSVSVYGVDAWDPPTDVRRRIGYVSEKQILDPSAKAMKFLKFCAGLYPAWDWAFCEELLNRFQIPRDRKISELSHGTQRQLALICAMGHRPELLVLDEPASGLDTVARRHILDILGAFVHEQGGTILISSHILTDLERIVSHVGILSNGEMVVSGALDDLKESIKRIRIIFPDDVTVPVSLKGQLRLQRSGREALVTVNAPDIAEVEALCRSRNATHEVQSVNLEELFIDAVEAEAKEGVA